VTDNSGTFNGEVLGVWSFVPDDSAHYAFYADNGASYFEDSVRIGDGVGSGTDSIATDTTLLIDQDEDAEDNNYEYGMRIEGGPTGGMTSSSNYYVYEALDIDVTASYTAGSSGDVLYGQLTEVDWAGSSGTMELIRGGQFHAESIGSTDVGSLTGLAGTGTAGASSSGTFGYVYGVTGSATTNGTSSANVTDMRAGSFLAAHTGMGTVDTAYAVHASSSGADASYAVYADEGSSYFEDSVKIGNGVGSSTDAIEARKTLYVDQSNTTGITDKWGVDVEMDNSIAYGATSRSLYGGQFYNEFSGSVNYDVVNQWGIDTYGIDVHSRYLSASKAYSDVIGANILAQVDPALAAEIEYFYGTKSEARLENGVVLGNFMGARNVASKQGGTMTGTILAGASNIAEITDVLGNGAGALTYGAYNSARYLSPATSSSSDITGALNQVFLQNSGTVDDVYGAYNQVWSLNTATPTMNGDVYGTYSHADMHDSTVSGTTYGLWAKAEQDNPSGIGYGGWFSAENFETEYAIYASSGRVHIEGIDTPTSPTALAVSAGGDLFVKNQMEIYDGALCIGDGTTDDCSDAGMVDGNMYLVNNLYVGDDGADSDSAIYFYENSSETGASIMFDDSADEFLYDHPIKVLTGDDVWLAEFSGNNATAASHIVNIVNASTSDDADGMRIELGVSTTNQDTSNDYINFVNGTENVGSVEGNNGVASVAYSTTGADYAELFSADPTDFNVGDVVTINTSGDIETGQTSSVVIGAHSTAPAVVGNWVQDWEDGNYVTVGMLGQIDMNVTDENGPIVPGDALTLSSTNGHLMKSTLPGTVIGRALESFVGPGTGQINVIVSPHWSGETVIGNDGTITTFSDDVAFTATGTADAGTPGYDSYELSLRGSGWDGVDPVAVDMTIKNTVIDSTDYRVSVLDTNDAEVAFVNKDGDLAISGRFYPSASGSLQTDKYIFYDDSIGWGGDMMRTNASGWSTGSYDFAEMFPSNDELETGDVVVFATDSVHVRRATDAYSTRIVGVVSTQPGFLAGDNEDGKSYPIALAGRVPVKVNIENGPIEIGDPLTSSSVAGEAMKATEAGRVIGFALEPFDGSGGDDDLLVFVESGWWGGGATDPTPGSDNTASGTASGGNANFTSINMEGNLYMNANDILNVGSIHGIQDRWTIDEDGRFYTEGDYVVAIESYQGEMVETHAVLSPENKIVVTGVGQLSSGATEIAFEDHSPVFNDIISTTEDYRVYVTLTDQANGVYVTDKTNGSFRVVELMNGNSDATFDWMVEAYRKDYEPEEEEEVPEEEPPVEAVCGDGVVEEPEQCDDANTEDGDGCSSICEEEVPAEDPPAEEPPAEEPPAEDPPIEEPPVSDPPVSDPPVEDPPIEEPPAEEPPVEDPPAEEPPAAPPV